MGMGKYYVLLALLHRTRSHTLGTKTLPPIPVAQTANFVKRLLWLNRGRLIVFLRREGFVVNHKRLFRIYREEGLMVRKRKGRKRAVGQRFPIPVPRHPNDLWAMDFVSDQFESGRRFRIWAVYDVCTRQCLGTVADISLTFGDVWSSDL